MKKPSLSFAVCLIFLLGACNKYEDGPFLSLRSVENRLCTTWGGMEESFLGTIEFPHELEFRKDGSFEERNSSIFIFQESFPGSAIGGSWEFQSDNERILLNFDSGESFELEIQRLTRNDFWFQVQPDESTLIVVKLSRDRD